MTLEEASHELIEVGWLSALLKMYWEVKYEHREIDDVFQELQKRGAADPDFGYPMLMVSDTSLPEKRRAKIMARTRKLIADQRRRSGH